jgi:hypothetical protein
MFDPRPEIRIPIRARLITSGLCDMTPIRAVKDLVEVVLQMNDVVLHQILERGGF